MRCFISGVSGWRARSVDGTHRAVKSLGGLDGGLVLLEVHEPEPAALALRSLFLGLLTLMHLNLAADGARARQRRGNTEVENVRHRK